MLLGQNEVQEATIVSNGYPGQFGTLAGANITYITKSGGNQYHGRAIYYWNGSSFNAQEWFSHQAGGPKPFSNANQWGGDIGGPIKKDKLFWYFNSEGLRVVLPSSSNAVIPSPDFEVATLNNLVTSGLTNTIPFYCAQGTTIASPTQGSFTCNVASPSGINSGAGIFNLFNNAPGASKALPGSGPTDTTGGCDGSVTLSGGAPCADWFRSQAGNFTYEYLLSTRVDWNIGSKDRMFIRVESDRGNQATYTDQISPIFNANSFQPEYQGQLVETHTFGASAVNQFILSGAWYSAIFAQSNPSGAFNAFPSDLIMANGSYSYLGGEQFAFPQGRNVTQIQAADDFSMTIGNHALKVGAKFRRYDITDHGYSDRLNGLILPLDQAALFDGGGTSGGDISLLQQNFPSRLTEPFAYYEMAGYVEDGWHIRPNLTITGALRLEHPSNVVCQTNCFAETIPWADLNHDPTIPYNQAIKVGGHTMLPGFTNIEWQPRVSFAWQPFGAQRNTVIRGGVGIFYDGFQASLAENFAQNYPNYNQFTVAGDNLSPTQTDSNLFLDAQALNTAFVNGFSSGGTVASIAASLPPNAAPFFSPPGLTTSQKFINAPQYQKWSLDFQQGIGHTMSFDVQYVGNHGIHEIVPDAAINAYCPASATTSCSLGGAGFAGLPTNPPDSRFLTTTLIQTVGNSNYNGITLSFKRQFASGIVNVNYSYSKVDDYGDGLEPFNYKTNTGIGTTEYPNSLQSMYGPADWDVRHYVSANYVWDLPIRRALFGHGWAPLVDGWTVSGTVFFRTGLPYTVIDGGSTSTLNSFGYGNAAGSNVFGNFSGSATGQAYMSCGAGGASVSQCLNPNLFSTAISYDALGNVTSAGFGNTTRNQFYGPHFFDADFTVMKKTKIPGWERGELGIGFQFFNVFNHPNFDQPLADVSNPNFGQIFTTVGPPTSILGSFLGGANSPRLIQVKAQLTF